MILSLFIVVLFISIDSIFKKSLFFSNFFEQRNINEVDLTSTLDSLKNNPVSSVTSWDYSIESLDYNWTTTFSWFLANKEWTELLVTWAVSTLSWKVNYWILNYKVLSFNSGNSASIFSSWTLTSTCALSSTWLILSFTWFNLDSSKTNNVLYLEWSWWLVSYNLLKWATNLLPQKNIYKLYKNTWNYKKFIRNFEIENFWVKSFTSSIDYAWFWLYP